MPELPEVETVRRGLAPVMEGATFLKVEQRRRDLRRPFPRAPAASFWTGAAVHNRRRSSAGTGQTR